MGQKNTKKNRQKMEKLNINNQQNVYNNKMTNQQNVNKSKENDLNINQKQINNPYLKYLNSIKEHNDWIESVKMFPSGNIISVSDDCSIKIFDGLNYKILQNMEYSHKEAIMNIYIKDENNFVTCSSDKNINIWTKDNNKFILKESIINGHNERITNLIYCSNNNIIACSDDSKMKIWELTNIKYQLLTTLTYSKHIHSLLLLEDKNILVSGGYEGTILWKIYEKGMNIEFIYYFKEAFCGCWNGLNRIDEDRIIVGGKISLKVISIKEMNIIKSIDIPFRCNGIIIIKEKRMFLIGGWSKDIQIYRSDNYEYLTTIKNAHSEYIVGFCKLKNDLILSFSGDTTMKIWSLN